MWYKFETTSRENLFAGRLEPAFAARDENVDGV